MKPVPDVRPEEREPGAPVWVKRPDGSVEHWPCTDTVKIQRHGGTMVADASRARTGEQIERVADGATGEVQP